MTSIAEGVDEGRATWTGSDYLHGTLGLTRTKVNPHVSAEEAEGYSGYVLIAIPLKQGHGVPVPVWSRGTSACHPSRSRTRESAGRRV